MIFVAAAGIFYLGAAENSVAEEGAQMILQKEELPQGTEGKTKEETGKLKEEVPQQVQELIYVYICGAVNAPGVYQLPAGSRIADAIFYAGDFSPDLDYFACS